MDESMMRLITQQMGVKGNEKEDSFAAINFDQINDPMVAMMASMIQQNQKKDADESEVEVYKKKLTRARKTIKVLRGITESAEGSLQYFAEVFGACPLCWGQDETCPDCQGRGTPGSRQPNKRELLVLVIPALRSLKMRVVTDTAKPKK